MKIKRYFAVDMRQAMRMVRDEQGPEAVILSNRSVEGGIEVIAAVDFDATALHQQASQQNDAPPQRPIPQASFSKPAPRKMPESVQTRPEPIAVPKKQASSPIVNEPGVTHARNEWLQDPLMTEMRDELRNLRSMLESQVAGLAWGDAARRSPLGERLVRRLLQLGLSPDITREIVATVPEDLPFDRAIKLSLKLLINKISTTTDAILTKGGVVALVGPTGVGKTTTIAKLAARYALRHGKDRVALVTTDNYRIGAHEQLRTFARILGVSLHPAKDAHDLSMILEELFDKELVLIDTAGMSQRDIRLSEQISLLKGSARIAQNYLVLSAASQLKGLDESIQAFSGADIQGCIITKLDEASSLGEALSVVIRHGLPIAYVSDGQKVPEDIHPARADDLINRCLSIAQHSGQDLDEAVLELAYGRMVANAHV